MYRHRVGRGRMTLVLTDNSENYQGWRSVRVRSIPGLAVVIVSLGGCRRTSVPNENPVRPVADVIPPGEP